MNLFVLVSTGQNQANLPPTLEYANRGDHILWIESDLAQELSWATGTSAVLKRHGLQICKPIVIHDINEPRLLSESLKTYLSKNIGNYESIYLVLNGGPKLTPLGLLYGCNPFSNKIRLLYGDEQPVECTFYPASLSEAPIRKCYERHQLSLDDIFCARGRVLMQGYLPVWPSKLPSEFEEEKYGYDAEYTYLLHQQHFTWAQRTQHSQGKLPFQQVRSLVAASYSNWLTQIAEVERLRNDQSRESLFNGTFKLNEQAQRQISGAQVQQPEVRIRKAFERAIIRRVRAWAVGRKHPAIHSIWANVRVAKDNISVDAEAEFDLLIVLKNTNLIHLEAKSAQVNPRELDTKLFRLKHLGSLAKQVVILPYYPERKADPWWNEIETQFQRLQDAGQEKLRFSIQNEMVTESDRIFEKELDRLFQKY